MKRVQSLGADPLNITPPVFSLQRKDHNTSPLFTSQSTQFPVLLLLIHPPNEHSGGSDTTHNTTHRTKKRSDQSRQKAH